MQTNLKLNKDEFDFLFKEAEEKRFDNGWDVLYIKMRLIKKDVEKLNSSKLL